MYRAILFFLLLLPLPLFATTESEVTIHMTENGFEPADVVIFEGDTITFVNDTNEARWPASNIHPTHTVYPGSDIAKCNTKESKDIFDACDPMFFGESYSFRFTKEGAWRYHDHEKPEFTGSIIVEDNPEFIEEVPKEKSFFGNLVSVFLNLKNKMVRLYYQVVPGALERRLGDTAIFDIADDLEKLKEIVNIAGSTAVMNKILEESEGGTTLDCHQQAHQVGRASYEVFGAGVFGEGDASCHSGYYHGMMEAFLYSEGTKDLSNRVIALCRSLDTDFTIFSCLHGIGHGVMAYEDYRLPEALEECHSLPDDFTRSACYGGVFMENIITAQGLGAVPGHETKWVSETDYHFPCNAVGDDYHTRFECYQMQTSWMLILSNYNWEKVAYECSRADTDILFACFSSMGRDIAGVVHREPNEIIKLCELAPKGGDAYKGCVYGAVNVVVEFWGTNVKNQGEEFCALVRDESVKDFCFTTVTDREQQILGNSTL